MGALRIVTWSLVVLSAACGSGAHGGGGSDGGGGGGGAGGGGGDLTDGGSSPCTADVTADPLNCGACGHDCLGGACQMGVCQPVTLADQRPGPGGIVVAKDTVFWTETRGGSVLQMPAAGGTPQMLTTGQQGASSITVDDSFVYFIAQSSMYHVFEIPIGGGTVTPIADGTGTPGVILVVGNALYWPSPSTGEILTYPLPGGPVGRFFATATPYSVALDDTAAFWTDQTAKTVEMLPAGAAMPTAIASTQPAPSSIALSPTTVAWIDVGTGADDSGIWIYPRSGGGPAVRLGPSGGAGTIAIDGGFVYWTDRQGGRVLRIAVDAAPGSDPTVLASGQLMPIKVVTDAHAIYWTNGGSSGNTGSVMKLAK